MQQARSGIHYDSVVNMGHEWSGLVRAHVGKATWASTAADWDEVHDAIQEGLDKSGTLKAICLRRLVLKTGRPPLQV